VSDNTKSANGFTIPELVISMMITGIIMVSLLSIVTYFFGIITRNSLMVEMSVDSQNLLRSTVEELRYGAGVRQSNTIFDANSPAGGWNTSNANFIIIIAVPAVNSTNDYIVDSSTGDPYNNELVYFKNGTTLYKRTLAHTSASGNRLITSCPAALAAPSCPADKKLVDNVDDMIFTLYDQDNGTTADPLLARSVKIDLLLKRLTFGNPLTLDNSIRVTLRNNFL
jgi:prepilin-type N-terminal cleavage/methylation domain-containing protein